MVATLMSNPVLAAQFDASHANIVKNLKEAGVSEKVLENLEHVSRPGAPGPQLQDPEAAELYQLLILEGLSEVAAKNAPAGSSKKAKASSKS